MIQVENPGLFTTVQDLGRYGYGPIGVSPSGAADPLALRAGNLLVGNPENTASLEMTLLGGAYHFSEDAVIAITGSDFGATADGSPLPMWTPCAIEADQTLRVGGARTGARSYLAVRGGFAVEPLLGSASTHILTSLGGFEGRQLRKGDVLNIGKPPAGKWHRPPEITSEIVKYSARRTVLRVTAAPQTDLFSVMALAAFYNGKFRVTDQSNRMGLRLEGPRIDAPYSGEMISEGVSLGAIQIPAGGQPIILFVEQQTTGGYPKIANIISADLTSVGQLRPNDVVQFEMVSPQTAYSLILEQDRLLQRLSSSAAKKIQKPKASKAAANKQKGTKGI
jgi:antagonist of KipI